MGQVLNLIAGFLFLIATTAAIIGVLSGVFIVWGFVKALKSDIEKPIQVTIPPPRARVARRNVLGAIISVVFTIFSFIFIAVLLF